MITLVLGGARSGKSELAERLAAASARDNGCGVTYIATMQIGDDAALAERVARHRERRPAGWATVEVGVGAASVHGDHTLGDGARAMADPDAGVGVGANARIGANARADAETGTDPDADTKVGANARADAETATTLPEALDSASGTVLLDSLGPWLAAHFDASTASFPADTATLCAALAGRLGDTIVVSDEVGLGVIPATAVGGSFRDALGALNQAVAAVADRVLLVVAGRTLTLDPPPER